MPNYWTYSIRYIVHWKSKNTRGVWHTIRKSARTFSSWFKLNFPSYRTPLCILYPPRIVAATCYILAQRIFDGPNSPSLDARISATSPSNYLPTPPSHKPPSPDASRAAIDSYHLTELELGQLGGLSIYVN